MHNCSPGAPKLFTEMKISSYPVTGSKGLADVGIMIPRESKSPSRGFLRVDIPIWGRRVLCFSMRTALRILAIPDALSAWPMLDLSDDTKSVEEDPYFSKTGGRSRQKAVLIASISAWSPACVPVPWASTARMASGGTFARSQLDKKSLACVGA